MAGGIAVMQISGELLRHMLHLPADCAVIGSNASEDDTVCVLVEHSTIPHDATQVEGIYRSVHGVTVFDHFEVSKTRDKAA